MIERWIFLRDGRLSRRAWLGLAALFVLALVALFPLRVALDLSGAGGKRMAAQAVAGTIWTGRIGELNAGPLPLGTVDAGIAPLPLLIGRAEVWLRRPDAAGEPFAAVVSGAKGNLSLRHVNGTVPLGGAAGALPVDSVGFGEFAMTMRDGKCTSAEGTLSLKLGPVSALLPGDMTLTGKAMCRDGALYVPMQGPSGMEKLLLKVGSDGKWTADLVFAGLPAEVSGPLLAMGFSPRPDGGLGLRAGGVL